jgi:C4-type Zn-finger protein
MERFTLTCPVCLAEDKVSFKNIQVSHWGLMIEFKCSKCKARHRLGGKPEYKVVVEGGK